MCACMCVRVCHWLVIAAIIVWSVLGVSCHRVRSILRLQHGFYNRPCVEDVGMLPQELPRVCEALL